MNSLFGETNIVRLLCLALFTMSIALSSAQARPVSYPGGLTLMLMNDGDRNSAHGHYSPTARVSLGYRFVYWREQDWTFHGMHINHLLKRWNAVDSQANVYLKYAGGVAYSRRDSVKKQTSAAGVVGVAADWEDRRYFISYGNRYVEAGRIDDFYTQSARIGWAPYEGDYNDLHTWIMLQADHVPEKRKPFTATTLLRLFKGVHMLEGGINNQGTVLFNYIFRH